jgi:hypothetical protein
MNTTARTFTFVAVAAVATVAAVGARLANRPASVDGFSDVGQLFFADFKDPLKATSLQVVKFDAESREPLTFKVMRNDQGLWLIPSHHDYPAEAKERLAKTATGLYGLKKTALQSRSKDDWARYGVLDPAADAAATLESTATDGKDDSHGTRITLSDASSNALVDLIVGKPVKGQSKQFYVREPDKSSVYIATVETDLSAKFSDWIEPDLLKLNQPDIKSLVIDNYSIDEERGAILKGEILTLSKDTTTSKWTLDGLNADLETLKDAPVTDLARNLDQLKIVGVRPKPAGVNADLTVTREVAQNPLLRQALEIDMQRKGFFIAGSDDGSAKLYSNEGELVAGTSTGVKYTLYFGEIARGSDKDIETGLNEAAEAPAAAASEGATPDGTTAAADATATNDAPKSDPTDDPAIPSDPSKPESGPRRYLLVKVEYDESLLGPKPAEPVAPEKPAILNDAASVDSAATPAVPAADTPATDAPAVTDPAAAAVPETAPPAASDPPAEPVSGAPATEPASTEPASSEPPQNPGSCDEPPAAEPATEQTSSATAEPVQETTPVETPVPTGASETQPEASQEPALSEPATVTTEPAATQPPAESNPAPAPTQPPVDPKAEAQKLYDQALGEYEAAKAAHETAVREWESKAKDGKKRAEDLALRFGAWYYVISAESFEKFKVTRADLVGPKEEPKPADGAAGAAAPGSPPGPNFNLPAAGTP